MADCGTVLGDSYTSAIRIACFDDSCRRSGQEWLAVSHDLLGKSRAVVVRGTNGDATLPKAGDGGVGAGSVLAIHMLRRFISPEWATVVLMLRRLTSSKSASAAGSRLARKEGPEL